MSTGELKQYLANLPENIKNFEFFIEELKKGNCVALVGAGLSKPLKIPDWEKLVYELARFSRLKYSKEEIEESLDKRLDVAEEARSYWEKEDDLDKYDDFLKERCQPKQVPYNPVHTTLLQVKFISYLTTNFDNVLDNAAKDVNDGEMLKNTQILPDFDPTLLRTRKLFYLHGKIQSRNIVLTRSEYDRAYGYKRMKDLLWNVYSNMTIVMIGFSLEDPYIQRLFENFSEQLNDMRRKRKTWGPIESEEKRRHFILKGTRPLQSKLTAQSEEDEPETPCISGGIY